MKMTYKGLECQIKARPGLDASMGELCSDAVIYGVSRLLARSESACREYVCQSYRMRLATGKGRRSQRRRCIIPAFLAEIDGELLRIDLTIDCSGVTIQNIRELKFSSRME